MKSIHAVILIAIIWIILGAVYYPKWNKPYSEATISWDVSGYYHYLPAIFIYKDIKSQAYMKEINKKYLPSPAYDQAFDHSHSGNKVNKYAIGQAVLFSPFFFIAHAWAILTHSSSSDGYSKPYQIAIWLGSILFSILGLILLRKILLHYFDDSIVMWTLLALGLGTHWMEYAAISNGMNHTWLFTLLCAMILFTIRFYKKADWTSAVGIGFSLGLAVLTRPTEIILVLIPILWGIGSIKDRFTFLASGWLKIFVAIIICGLIMSIQLIYWKYAAEEWIVYSYGGQGFNWFNPNIWRGLMGAKIGWWLYTPIMLLTMFGWYGLCKSRPSIFWPTFVTGILAIYITLSWGHWEEGGGLGQRNLIQAYPLFAFPLATVISWFCSKPPGKWIWIIILIANMYYTGWWVHQAHKGGFFHPGQMNTPYFYSVAGRLFPDRDMFKLLDTREYYKGTPKAERVIFSEDFELDSLACEIFLADTTKSACLNGEAQYLGPYLISLDNTCQAWIRLEGDFTIQTREWDSWKFTQWIVHFFKGEETIKTNFIKLQRLLPADQLPVHLFFDVRIPDVDFDKCTMTFWNAGSSNTIMIDNLQVSCFQDH